MKRKWYITAGLCLIVAFVLVLYVSSKEEPIYSVYIDGIPIELAGAPIIKDNVLLMGVAVIEQLPAVKLSKLNDTTIEMTHNSTKIELQAGSAKAFVNSDEQRLLSPMIIYRKQMMVPIEFVINNLGYDIEWNKENNSIYILTKKQEWYKNEEINMIVDAGPARTPINVNLFMPIGRPYNFKNGQEIEFEVEVLNTSSVPYSRQLEDIRLIEYTPVITIQSFEQDGKFREYVIRKELPVLKDVKLAPGESYSIKWSWNQKDQYGNLIPAGGYVVGMDFYEKPSSIIYENQEGKQLQQEVFICYPFSYAYINIK